MFQKESIEVGLTAIALSKIIGCVDEDGCISHSEWYAGQNGDDPMDWRQTGPGEP